MKRYLILALLLAILVFCAASAGAAEPGHVYVVGDCRASATEAIEIFQKSGDSPKLDLYIICTEKDWILLSRICGFPVAAVAAADYKQGEILLGPRALNRGMMRHAIEHELEHLRCRCNVGESSGH